ncbi:MAG: heme exporter protein CcmB [Gammaproteobacteria bacterium]
MLRLVKAETYKLSKKLKSWLGPLLIMVLVLIAFPLSIDISQFDEEDFEDGSLEQEFLIEKDFYKLALIKIFVFVFLIGIPIALIGALFSFANGVEIDNFAKVFLLLSLSNLLLFNLFAFGNALSINKGAMLGVLSSLPLALPVIILLGRAIRSIQYGDGFLSIIALMMGVGLLMSAVMPLIISAALKTHID